MSAPEPSLPTRSFTGLVAKPMLVACVTCFGEDLLTVELGVLPALYARVRIAEDSTVLALAARERA